MQLATISPFACRSGVPYLQVNQPLEHATDPSCQESEPGRTVEVHSLGPDS